MERMTRRSGKRIDLILLLVAMGTALTYAAWSLWFTIYGMVFLDWGLFGGICLLLFLPLLCWRPSRAKMWACFGFLVLLTAIALVPWTPGARFMAAAGLLKSGMSESTIQSSMKRYKRYLRVHRDPARHTVEYSWYMPACWDTSVVVICRSRRVVEVKFVDLF